VVCHLENEAAPHHGLPATNPSLPTAHPVKIDAPTSSYSSPRFLDAPMSDLAQPESLADSAQAHLDLFMTVVRVMDWSAIVPWYIEVLGMVPILIDAEHEFALLAAGGGRLGFKGIKSHQIAHERTKVRFVFQVQDVDRERQRLVERGIVVSVPFDNREEGYREVRLHDPEGNSLTMFTWSDPTRNGRFSNGRP
jgi:predicted enzyme related to lactoylglutathione lyase